MGHVVFHKLKELTGWVTTITDLLDHNTALEDVQHLAGHADPRTTRLHDRRRRKITRNVVERISINVDRE
jgi:integrase/recombinase XerD